MKKYILVIEQQGSKSRAHFLDKKGEIVVSAEQWVA
ncbi:MAG: hypothetical protein ACI9BD_000700, partial [Candidatus Marinamargulisbacteria bacterium]